MLAGLVLVASLPASDFSSESSTVAGDGSSVDAASRAFSIAIDAAEVAESALAQRDAARRTVERLHVELERLELAVERSTRSANANRRAFDEQAANVARLVAAEERLREQHRQALNAADVARRHRDWLIGGLAGALVVGFVAGLAAQ